MLNRLNGKFKEAVARVGVGLLHLKLKIGWIIHGSNFNGRRGAGNGIIVSLTSYPPRFGTLHLTLKSLLSQSFAPERIVLWIAHGDMHALPEAVTGLVKNGLEIKACEDLKSYKKLIPMLQERSDATIVIADDDIFYWRDWLQGLLDARVPGRSEVICYRMHRIRLGANGDMLPYNDWEFMTTTADADVWNFPTGMGGVLYPAGIFGPEVLNKEAFSALCPRGDDIWFWWMARANGASFKCVPTDQEFYCWEGSQECALWQDNLVGKFNDTQINSMIAAYGFFNERRTA